MNLLFLLLAELGIVACGFGTAALLKPRRPVSLVELIGLSLLLGQMVLTLGLFVFGAFLRGHALVAAIALLAFGLGFYGLRAWRQTGWATAPGQRRFLLTLVPILLLVGWQAVVHPVSADGLFNFEMRAQFAVQNGGWLPAGFYSEPSRQWANLRYPLFLPLTQAWLYLCLGAPHQGLVQLLAVHFTAAALCLLYDGVARLTGEAWRGAVAAGLFVLLPAAMFAPGGACTLWADFPSALAFLGALLYLVEYSARGDGLRLLAAFLVLLPWVKREGVILVGVVALSLLWIAWRRRELRRALPALASLATFLLGWQLFLSAVHALPSRDLLPLTVANGLAHVDRLPLSALALVREFFVWQRWGLLWPLAIPALLHIARSESLKPWRVLAAPIILPLMFFTGLPVFSALTFYALGIGSSLPRLMLPVAMPALLAIAVAVPHWRAEKNEPHPA